MGRGFGSWELEARSSGSGFGRPPKLTGQRPVLPVSSRSNGAAVYQPRASAAPPWVKGASHFISKHPPKHGGPASRTEARLGTSMPKSKRRQSRRTPKRCRARAGAVRAWSMGPGFGSWELEARSSGSGFGRPPKPTGLRPVLPSRYPRGQLTIRERAGATIGLRIANRRLARSPLPDRPRGPCRTAGNLSECPKLVWAVAERRLDGSRGLQPTVGGKPKLILRRAATPEIGQACIQASLREASGWAAPEPWVQTHRYLQRTASRCLDAASDGDAGLGGAGF
jgi:hypothetical protein